LFQISHLILARALLTLALATRRFHPVLKRPRAWAGLMIERERK